MSYLGIKIILFSIIFTLNNQILTKFETVDEKNNASEFDEIRLPKDLIPYYYDIKISTNFHGYIKPTEYNGTVGISFKCVNTTNKLIFHSKSLEIRNNSIKIQSINDTNVETTIKNIYYDSQNEFLIISLDSTFKPNQYYKVLIHFKGFIKNDYKGFFSSSFNDDKGIERWIMASQFQPFDARKAFPCFDEPWMKARFKITTVHHRSYFALSNMPVLTTKTM
jgi:aminopeptidase N